MTHTLNQALDMATGRPEEWEDMSNSLLGELMYAAANALIDETDFFKTDHLETVIVLCRYWWKTITHTPDSEATTTFDALVHAEYDRADRKHDGNTPYNPSMSDDDRAAILGEEVGEVARALTPDAHTAVGHAGNLVDELVQTATMAAAWLARILDDKEGR